VRVTLAMVERRLDELAGHPPNHLNATRSSWKRNSSELSNLTPLTMRTKYLDKSPNAMDSTECWSGIKPAWVSMAMLKSPLVARKSPRSLAGVEVSSGAVTSLVLGVAHAERFAVGDDDAGVVEEPVKDAGGGGVLG
jgi:hypothetical protein